MGHMRASLAAGLSGHKSKAFHTTSVRDAVYRNRPGILGYIPSPSVHASLGQAARVGGSAKRLRCSHTYN